MVEIINQVFSLEQKSKRAEIDTFNRNIERIYKEFEEMGYKVINPAGQRYRNEMTDVEANIIGDISSKMIIKKVLKPIIYQLEDNQTKLIQKGIVTVE